MIAGCGKRRVEPRQEHVEVRDQGTACLRIAGGVFQGPGFVQVEATVTVSELLACSDFDFAHCTVETDEHGQIHIASSMRTLPPHGRCDGGRGPLVAQCRAVVPMGLRDIIFGRGRRSETISLGGQAICIDG
jgi:hypothetical protein